MKENKFEVGDTVIISFEGNLSSQYKLSNPYEEYLVVDLYNHDCLILDKDIVYTYDGRESIIKKGKEGGGLEAMYFRLVQMVEDKEIIL